MEGGGAVQINKFVVVQIYAAFCSPILAFIAVALVLLQSCSAHS